MSQSTIMLKVAALFHELAGESAGLSAQQVLEKALNEQYPSGVAHDIAFHLTDWQSDAAFLVAVGIFPERFTPDEIRAGITNFIVHAPNHVAAAAKLAGFPISDVFNTGAIDGIPEV